MPKIKNLIACMAALAVLMVVQSAVSTRQVRRSMENHGNHHIGPKPLTITGMPPNLLIFTKKHFSYIGITTRNLGPTCRKKAPQTLQKLSMWTPFNAYAGTYELKGTTITFHSTVAEESSSDEAGALRNFRLQVGRGYPHYDNEGQVRMVPAPTQYHEICPAGIDKRPAGVAA